MVDISIVIVSWNAKDYLLACLRSIRQTQGGLSVEVVVVDNASGDGSADAVAEQFPETRLLRNARNLGFAAANNQGIRETRGRHVFLVNSDVVVLEGCLQALVEFLDSHPQAGMIAPRIVNRDGSLQVSCREFPGIRNSLVAALGVEGLSRWSRFFRGAFMDWWSHDSVREVDVLSGCFWAIRREALDSVGLLDELFFIYGEDVDWCRRFHDAGWKVLLFPGAQAIHFGGASSANAPTRFYIEMQKARLQYWRKHHGPSGQAACWAIIFLHQCVRVISRSVGCVIQPSRRKAHAAKIGRSLACLRWLVTPKGMA